MSACISVARAQSLACGRAADARLWPCHGAFVGTEALRIRQTAGMLGCPVLFGPAGAVAVLIPVRTRPVIHSRYNRDGSSLAGVHAQNGRPVLCLRQLEVDLPVKSAQAV